MLRRNLLLSFAAVTALAACQREPETAEAPPPADAGASRAITDPSTVVRGFYDPYLVPNGQIPPLAEAALQPIACQAAQLVLMQSTLTPQGPMYEVLKEAPFRE